MCNAEQARRVHHVRRNRQRSRFQSSGRRLWASLATDHHGTAHRQHPPAARCGPMQTAQTDRTWTIPLRTCRPVFHSLLRTAKMSTFPVFQRHWVVDDNTRFHAPIWQNALNELVPHEELFRLFHLAMDDLTRRQPRRMMLEDDYWCDRMGDIAALQHVSLSQIPSQPSTFLQFPYLNGFSP